MPLHNRRFSGIIGRHPQTEGGIYEAAPDAREGSRGGWLVVDRQRVLSRPRSGIAPALVLLLILVLFCAVTRWGRTYPQFASRTVRALVTGLGVDAEARRRAVLDETYPFLLYLREVTPPQSVILLPPRETIIAKLGVDTIPLLASASSAYSFIYPRVPVHDGDASPYAERANMIFVWDYWGLERVDPQAPRDEEHRYKLYPWTPGGSPP
jgi:hypothetical protein